MKKTFKQDKGQAGLTILLSIIVMLFVIGLIVMIFTLMGTNMRDATYTSTVLAIVNETVLPTDAGTEFGSSIYRNRACGTITAVLNLTNDIPITAGNYTQQTSLSGCNLTNLTSEFDPSWRVSYPVTYDADNTATNVMNDTYTSIATTVDWFDIFIVIGAMVVLILLTVIIITAIRSSGMIAGGTQGANQVGTA